MITNDGRARKRVEPLALQTRQEGVFFKSCLWWLAGERDEPLPTDELYRIEAERAEYIREHARALAIALAAAGSAGAEPKNWLRGYLSGAYDDVPSDSPDTPR